MDMDFTRCCFAFIVFSLALCANQIAADFEERTEDDFLQASERCFQRERPSAAYRRRFENFDYPDEPSVHRYVHCIWTELRLWTDRSGFNVAHIAALYRDKANTEVLIPILTECNQNVRNDAPPKWCYNAFQCVLNSRVGQWFKEDVGRRLHETTNMNHHNA